MSHKPTLPIQLNFAGKICVVIGGGMVATRKVESLIEAGCEITLASPNLTSTLASLEKSGHIQWIESIFRPEHLENASLIFAATDNPSVNEAVSAEARRRGIPVNRADNPDAGDFITPAVLRRGSLVVTVSTEGGSPALTAHLLRELEQNFVEDWAALVELFAAFRDYIKENYPISERATLNRKLIAQVGVFREILNTQDFEAAFEQGKAMIVLQQISEESKA